ncbi:hypothetical protein KC867_02645, partial [Candidatus Saccharibacteria bacterium]|nr:hypothetical protein [Candidatus Saccharibacteria bacterium]
LMPDDGNTRKLRQILKEAGDGKEADQAEVNAAVGQLTKFLIPVMIFFFTIHIAAALSLYWFVTGLIAIIQQTKVLKEDEVDIAQSLHKDDASNKRGSKTSSSGRKKVQSTARVVSVSSVSKESDKSGGFNKTTATDIKTKTTKRKSTKGGSSKSKKRS